MSMKTGEICLQIMYINSYEVIKHECETNQLGFLHSFHIENYTLIITIACEFEQLNLSN